MPELDFHLYSQDFVVHAMEEIVGPDSRKFLPDPEPYDPSRDWFEAKPSVAAASKPPRPWTYDLFLTYVNKLDFPARLRLAYQFDDLRKREVAEAQRRARDPLCSAERRAADREESLRKARSKLSSLIEDLKRQDASIAELERQRATTAENARAWLSQSMELQPMRIERERLAYLVGKYQGEVDQYERYLSEDRATVERLSGAATAQASSAIDSTPINVNTAPSAA